MHSLDANKNSLTAQDSESYPAEDDLGQGRASIRTPQLASMLNLALTTGSNDSTLKNYARAAATKQLQVTIDIIPIVPGIWSSQPYTHGVSHTGTLFTLVFHTPLKFMPSGRIDGEGQAGRVQMQYGKRIIDPLRLPNPRCSLTTSNNLLVSTNTTNQNTVFAKGSNLGAKTSIPSADKVGGEGIAISMNTIGTAKAREVFTVQTLVVNSSATIRNLALEINTTTPRHVPNQEQTLAKAANQYGSDTNEMFKREFELRSQRDTFLICLENRIEIR